jgi:hypothetical protein
MSEPKFSIKNIIRNEVGEITGFTAWYNGQKVHFAKSLFDPSENTVQWVDCQVMYKDGKRTMGKINIGAYDRLSDFMNMGPQFIPFSDSTDGAGKKGKFKIINKDEFREVVPTAGERCMVKAKKPEVEWIEVK